MKVIEALESGISFDGPAGKTTIDPQTHHTILDVYIGEAPGHEVQGAARRSRSSRRPTPRRSAT